jgi:hypothetical protein
MKLKFLILQKAILIMFIELLHGGSFRCNQGQLDDDYLERMVVFYALIGWTSAAKLALMT